MLKCKLCSHKVRTIFDRQFKINYYYCTQCEFLFMDEAAIVPPQREREEYLTHHDTLENEGYVNMFREFVEKAIIPFQEGPSRGKFKALDFGSGPGDCVLAHVLREEKGYDVDIFDVYFAPEKVFIDKTYDLITCTEVLEHLEDPLETLKFFKNHLEPGGILALMTLFHPVGEENPEGEEQFQQWWYRRDVTHISFFRPQTFRFISNLLDMKLLMMDERNTVTVKMDREIRGKHEKKYFQSSPGDGVPTF